MGLDDSDCMSVSHTRANDKEREREGDRQVDRQMIR